MEKWRGKTAIVTGASSGIGWAIAKTLAEEGLIVIAVARREERLKELANSIKGDKNGKVIPCTADVTKSDQVNKVLQAAESLGGVSVLVNNAGIAYNTKVTDGDIEKWRWMFELNVIAAGAFMNGAVKSMKKNGIAGHIINISSISAHGIPQGLGKHIYNGSKHALRLITEGVRAELTEEKSNIKITMVSPGLVDTEIFEAGNFDIDEMRALPNLKGEDIAMGCVQVLSTHPNVLVTEYIIRPVGETIPA